MLHRSILACYPPVFVPAGASAAVPPPAAAASAGAAPVPPLGSPPLALPGLLLDGRKPVVDGSSDPRARPVGHCPCVRLMLPACGFPATPARAPVCGRRLRGRGAGPLPGGWSAPLPGDCNAARFPRDEQVRSRGGEARLRRIRRQERVVPPVPVVVLLRHLPTPVKRKKTCQLVGSSRRLSQALACGALIRETQVAIQYSFSPVSSRAATARPRTQPRRGPSQPRWRHPAVSHPPPRCRRWTTAARSGWEIRAAHGFLV